jgi:hypothetical protein
MGFGHHKRILIAILMGIMGWSCTDTPLERYVPQKSAEAEIVALLVQYQDARKNLNVQRYLDCLHDRGAYHYASRIMVSKKELTELLPGFWKRLQQGDRSFFPMCRENLSGNYFVGFRLVNPSISVMQNTARVTVTYVNAGWRLKHDVFLVKEKDRWFINRLDWETG